MTAAACTPAQRIGQAMSFRPPDRVPFFLHAHMHAARHLGLGIRECLESPRHVVAASLHLVEWLGHDAVTAAAPAAFELEPWGGVPQFSEVGPPTAGPPPIRADDIARLAPPTIAECPRLRGVLQAFEMLRAAVGDAMPVVGSVVSPFSLPVVQLGFEAYLEVLFERPADFERLMEVNEAFCLEWARAQVRAGASTMAYGDPVMSPTCLPIGMARHRGVPVARRFIRAVGVPCSVSFASGLGLPLVDDVADIGASGIGISAQEDLREALQRCRGRMAVMGNLNALAMTSWSLDEAAAQARVATEAGAAGGLFLTDNHGEIPATVGDDVLSTIADTIRRGTAVSGN